LIERQTVACEKPLLWNEDFPKQIYFHARLDSLVNRSLDVCCSDVIPEPIIKFQQFITQPGAIKR